MILLTVSIMEKNQRNCVILVVEVYIKSLLLYHGGSLFGKVDKNLELLANAVLITTVNCLIGRPLIEKPWLTKCGIFLMFD